MNNSITIDIYNYNEFDLFCRKYIDNFDTVGYDIETNALDTHSIDYRVVGFSLASSSSIGCYVCLDSIDFTMNVFDKKSIEDRLSSILLNKQIIIFNCMHELPATLNWLNVEIPNWDDLLIMVKLMMGTATVYKGNGGLKIQSVMHLGYEDWSKDLDDYVDEIKVYKKDKDTHLENIKKILLKYYGVDEIDNIMCMVKHYAEDIISQSKEFSYGFIPSKLIARYGSIDSSVLFDLKEFYVDWMKRESKNLEIDLFKGYEYWKMHHYAGYILERNGAYWNDDKAKVIEKWCIDGKIESLKFMIKSPLMRDYIKQSTKDLYEKYLYDNYCDEMIDNDLYTIKRRYSKSVGVVPNNSKAEDILHSMSIYPNKQGIFKLEFGNIIYMGRNFIKAHSDIYDSWFTDFFDNLTNGDKSLDELKAVFNPLSTNTVFRDYVSKMLITDKIRYAKVYDNIVKFTEEPNFNLENYINENQLYVDDCSLVSLVHKLNISDYSKSDRFDMFLEFMSRGVNFSSWKIKKLVKNALDEYKFESMDSETFNTIYELYLMCHIDVENRETWNEEFEWIFNYKMFRKFDKLQSTYIEGTTARKNVYMVDKNSYSNGDILTRREEKYSHDIVLPSDKQYLMQANFKVNMANTGRWTCFTGDTKIKSLDGNSYSFEELVNTGVKELWIYSIDESGNVVPAKAFNPHITKYVDEYVEIVLDSGDIVKCTADHLFMLRDGSYKKAEDLKCSDSLMPLYLRLKNSGKYQYYQYYNHNKNKYEYVHTMVNSAVNFDSKNDVLQEIDETYSKRDRVLVTHHKDFNRLNNQPNNLSWMTWKSHTKLHSQLGKDNIIKYNKSQKHLDYTKSDKRKQQVREQIIARNKTTYAREISRVNSYKHLNSQENRKKASERIRIKNSNAEFQKNANDSKVLKIFNRILSDGLEVNESTYNMYWKHGFISWKNLIKKYNVEEMIERSKTYNHFVVSKRIVKLENSIPVYDITVNDYHNFALDCGVFVHNCGMHNLPASDAIKGIFTSRFKGGCIAMPDGSQMEVRTLAAESHDESLLQAFKDGIDIHRFFASKIYNVPYEDVQKWQRGLAKNAVFGMLYGESEQTFADTYLGGDLSRAKEVFDGMFSGFPKIKDYIDRKHKQYTDMKKITTLTQRYIDFSDSRENPDRILRQSQNYPIQASAEDIAGVILYKLIEWLQENNMKSKPFCFIHDSIEIDMHPDEVFKILDKLDYLFNKFPLEEFGVPVACDVPLSMSMGAEIEVKSLVCKNDYNDVEIVLSGFEDDIDELIDNWLETYKSVKIDYKYVPSESDKDVYMPIAERFLPKKAPVSMKQGTYRKNIERKFYISVK